jgi:hypothetical protein
MTARPWDRSFSERLLSSTIGTAARGFGPLPAMVIGFLYGVGGAGAMLIDARPFAAALLILAAWRGGTAALLAEREGIPPWQRAAAAVLNVSAECCVVAAAAIWAHQHEDRPGALAVGMLAFGGVLLLSYARVRIEASAGMSLPDGPYGIASREVRLLILAIAMLAGATYWALIAIAILTHGSVAVHLYRLRMDLRGQ